jgi:hypothetical protein
MIRKTLDVRVEGEGKLLVIFGVRFNRKASGSSNSFGHVEIVDTRLGLAFDNM